MNLKMLYMNVVRLKLNLVYVGDSGVLEFWCLNSCSCSYCCRKGKLWIYFFEDYVVWGG